MPVLDTADGIDASDILPADGIGHLEARNRVQAFQKCCQESGNGRISGPCGRTELVGPVGPGPQLPPCPGLDIKINALPHGTQTLRPCGTEIVAADAVFNRNHSDAHIHQLIGHPGAIVGGISKHRVGIAGLSLALKAAEAGRVGIVTKKSRAESNTNYAQGGIACVTSAEDSFELHVQDTLRCGAGLCREAVVRAIVEEGPARIRELIDIGMRFTEREIDGGAGRELDLGREGGHSKRRVLHAKDATGREVERALLAAIEAHDNIEVFEDHIGVNLITGRKVEPSKPDRCLGLYALDRRASEVHTFVAPVTVLATGGCGQVYLDRKSVV